MKTVIVKMLLKLTPGFDFTNILHKTFSGADPKSAKKTDGFTVFSALLGSDHKKIACKMLVKLTPGSIFKCEFIHDMRSLLPRTVLLCN